jgi:hypothetical protein
MTDITEIIEFVKEETGARNVTEDSDIETGLGCYGDDFDELIEKYSKSFNVDMSTYLWYFHTGEEGYGSIGGLFFKPPNSRVQRIPVTPKMLLEFAQEGKWSIEYPKHKIPEKRYDVLVNQIVLVTFVICVICYYLFK